MGLLLFKAANPAAIWTIFICSIWPMIMNTAAGVQRVPQDYLNVARVLDLVGMEGLPAASCSRPCCRYMLTGVRLSIGTAWLVIVAAEMLTGGTGIGFWLWDEWNNLKVEHIVIAIFVIGVVGLIARAPVARAGPPLQLRQQLTAPEGAIAMEKFVSIENVGQTFKTRKGPFVALRDINLGIRRGRVHHADRPFRLRQVHAAEPDCRPDHAPPPACCCARGAKSPGPGPDARRGVPEPFAAALADAASRTSTWRVERVFATPRRARRA